jgi:hypothetical protein
MLTTADAMFEKCHKEIHASETSRDYSMTSSRWRLTSLECHRVLDHSLFRLFRTDRRAGLTSEDLHSYVEADRRKLTQIKHVFAARGARETGGCCLSHDALYLHESTLIVVP